MGGGLAEAVASGVVLIGDHVRHWEFGIGLVWFEGDVGELCRRGAGVDESSQFRRGPVLLVGGDVLPHDGVPDHGDGVVDEFEAGEKVGHATPFYDDLLFAGDLDGGPESLEASRLVGPDVGGEGEGSVVGGDVDGGEVVPRRSVITTSVADGTRFQASSRTTGEETGPQESPSPVRYRNLSASKLSPAEAPSSKRRTPRSGRRWRRAPNKAADRPTSLVWGALTRPDRTSSGWSATQATKSRAAAPASPSPPTLG